MSWGEMVREWQKGGACSRFSYVLVLLASLLAFDFEPSGGSERLAPGGVYRISVEDDTGNPSPTLKSAHALLPLPRATPTLREHSAAIKNDRAFLALWTSHFDARGPPLWFRGVNWV